MKKLLSALFATMLSFSVMADSDNAPLVTMESLNGNIAITFKDFANQGAHEHYECWVVFSWGDHKVGTASKVIIDGLTYYRCLDQGNLTTGVKYDVYLKFENWPENHKLQTAMYRLEAGQSL